MLDGELPEDEMNLEAVRGPLDELFLLARHYRKSEEFQKLLDFVAGFRRYSAFNAMLVYVQMPGAKYVLPAKRWFREFGRLPIPDAQPLVMLQPMTPIMLGFDVSQTCGQPLPLGFDNPFRPTGVIEAGHFDMTVQNARRDGVEIQSLPLGSTLGGYVRNAGDPMHRIGVAAAGNASEVQIDNRRVKRVAEITLNSNLSAETNYATLTHELGHLYCGHIGSSNKKLWPDRRTLDRNTQEFEAESVSYLVCKRAGLQTPAVAYLNGYLQTNELVPTISVECVFKAAQRVEAMAKKKLKVRTPDAQESR